MKQVFKCSHISFTHLLVGPAQREAGIWKPHLHESKGMQLDTVSLSRFKEQWHDTIDVYHIYCSQRVSKQLNSLNATNRATTKPPAGNSRWLVLPRVLLGRVLATQSSAIGYTAICSMNTEHASAWASAPGLFTYPCRHCLPSCRTIRTHREGRREERAAVLSVCASSR